jgi:hypothetical protein
MEALAVPAPMIAALLCGGTQENVLDWGSRGHFRPSI